MADNRASRDTESRNQFQRPQSWRAPEILPMPDPRPGWTHRYIRISMMGKDDPQNISSKFREGWEPVKAEEYPELMIQAAHSGQFKGNIEIGGLLLCKRPEEFGRQEREYFANQTRAQGEAVDNNLMRQSDSRMPIFQERRSTTSFGRGSN